MHGGDQDHRVPKLDLLHNYTLRKKGSCKYFFSVLLQICKILPGTFVTFYNGSKWPLSFALAGLFSGHVLHFL